MQRLFLQFVALAALLAASLTFPPFSGGTQAAQAQLPEEPCEGVLILRNGHVLIGEVVRSGNRFNVSVDGGRISVSVADTEFFCRNLKEAYEHKRLSVGTLDVHGHLELAGWCQRQGLLELANRELLDASRLAPAHPMIPVIERRIQMSLTPPSPAEPADIAAVSVQPPLSLEELDRTARDMPPGTMETFSRSIQPLLFNRCGAARCHGPASDNELRLLRPPASSRPSRRTTQRNLHAILKLINRRDPTRSPLLTAALRPHGNLDVPVFAGHRADQFERIANWVHLVAKGPANIIPAAHEEPVRQHGEQAVSALHTAPATVRPPGRPAGIVGESPLEGLNLDRKLGHAIGQPDQVVGTPSIPHHPQVKRGGLPPLFTPIDPFDPEIFNRRFHPRDSRGE